MCDNDTFLSLLGNAAHWEFELLLEFLSFIAGLLVWPLVRKTWMRFFHRHNECCEAGPIKCYCGETYQSIAGWEAQGLTTDESDGSMKHHDQDKCEKVSYSKEQQ